MSVNDLFRLVSDGLKREFEYQAKLLGTPGEVGTGRENVLKRILTKYIPKRYAVDSGIAIDTSNRRSQQIDIIIYEADYTPIFEIVEGKNLFPCETVVAVGQVKTNIGSSAEFQECLDNIASVKQLDRSNKGKNLPITGPGFSLQGVKFDPNTEYRDQIFGFIFCSSSIQPDLMNTELRKFNEKHERRLWANTIVNYNKFLIEYLGKGGFSQNPMTAEKLALIDESQFPYIFTLFVSIINEFLNQAHIARPNLFDYCNIGSLNYSESPI
jgi:hypothetical protein